jgi:hypothetical protein
MTATILKTSTNPSPAPLELTVCTKAFSTGDNLTHNQHANNAVTAPAMKLFSCGRNDGKYKKPDPDECGGMMKMS